MSDWAIVLLFATFLSFLAYLISLRDPAMREIGRKLVVEILKTLREILGLFRCG